MIFLSNEIILQGILSHPKSGRLCAGRGAIEAQASRHRPQSRAHAVAEEWTRREEGVKRRGFLGALLGAPVAALAAKQAVEAKPVEIPIAPAVAPVQKMRVPEGYEHLSGVSCSMAVTFTMSNELAGQIDMADWNAFSKK